MTMTSTLSSPLPRTRRPSPLRSPEHATHGLDAHDQFIVDSYTLLDHRTRERTIAGEGAPPGRYLSVQRGDETLLIALERPITHIGRGLVADIRLEDSQVSRRHAIVAVRGSEVRVLDDRSSNGTFVNGRPVTVAVLADGDVMRFGRVALRYAEVSG